MFSVCAEFLSYFIGFSLIENKYYGRKRTLIYGYVLSSIACLGAYFSYSNLISFIIFCTIVRIFFNLNFDIIYPFTSELYNTKIRNTGLGCSSVNINIIEILNNYKKGFSRIGGIIMPWILSISINKMGITGPFLFYLLLCIISACAIYSIPKDTTGIFLDQY